MDWIDDTIAIGSWMDAHCVRILKRERIDLMIDSRTLFLKKSRSMRNEPNIALVNKSAEMMIALSDINAKVLVYCRHGKDRSPFLAMVYLSKKHGMPCEEAYQLVRSKRPRTVYHREWVKMLEPSKQK
jgi:hypothetical protein